MRKQKETGWFLAKGIAGFHRRVKEELWSLKRAFENDPEGSVPTYETRTLAGAETLPYGSMTAQTATNSPTQGSGVDALYWPWDGSGRRGTRPV